MGGLGSDAAIEAADVVIMTDEPSKLLNLMDIAKKTLVIAKQNVIFALAVKLLVLVLCAVGLVNMWAAVFADVGERDAGAEDRAKIEERMGQKRLDRQISGCLVQKLCR